MINGAWELHSLAGTTNVVGCVLSSKHLHLPHNYCTMARRPVNKSIKKKTEDSYQKCCYCSTNRDTRGFDKHLAACKIWFAAQNENHVVHAHANASTAATLNPLEPANFLEPANQQMDDLVPLHTDSHSDFVPQSSAPAKGQYYTLVMNCTMRAQMACISSQLPMVLNFQRSISKSFPTLTPLIRQ